MSRELTSKTPDSPAWAQCYRQWKFMQIALTLLLIAGFCVSLFGKFLPKKAVLPSDYFIALFMLAAAGWTIGWIPVRIFDPESREKRFDDVSFAYSFRWAPVAGLIGWLMGMALWIRHLHGWTPETLSFFVVNPFGIWMVALATGFCALRFMMLLTLKFSEWRKGE